MKKNMIATALIALSLALPVWAFDGPPRGDGPKQGQHEMRGKHGGKQGKIHEKLKNMTDEERKAFQAEVQEKWNALSEQEKAEFKAKMEARQKEREERRLVRQYGIHLLIQQENASE